MATNVTGVSGDYVATDTVRTPRVLPRLSWGAIFAGVVIAVAVQVLLGILGTGIGLSIVKQLIESERGTVGAEFPPTGGSVFWFELPISPGA